MKSLRSKNGTTVRYFLTDHLGSTEALTDATGAIVSSTSYDSFGNATTSIPTSYRYTGREYDSDTGLYYYRNRWYDPEIGRFISTDPIGFSGGDINLYGYVGNSPYGYIDPFGHFPGCPLGFGGFGGSGRFNGGPSSGWWDAVQGALDVAGLAPGAGILADLANAGISVARGNYADAALNMAAAVPLAGTVAGLAKLARKAKETFFRGNSIKKRVFWSGPGSREAAESFARASGGQTLEMTLTGKTLDKITTPRNFKYVKPLWSAASKNFARGAKGSVDVFHSSKGVRLESVWAKKEFPILKRQGNKINYHVVK